jgi:GH18 family chitinase
MLETFILKQKRMQNELTSAFLGLLLFHVAMLQGVQAQQKSKAVIAYYSGGLQTVEAFNARSMTAKLIAGAAFYARTREGVANTINGLYQTGDSKTSPATINFRSVFLPTEVLQYTGTAQP